MASFFARLTQIQSRDEDTLRRGRTAIVVALVMIGLAILAIPISFLSDSGFRGVAIIGAGIFGYIIVITLTRAGFVDVGGLILTTFVVLPILAPIIIDVSPSSPFTSPFYLVLALLVAGLILPPVLVWIVLAVNLTGLIIA